MARFSGSRLSDDDRRALGEMQRGGSTMTARQWRRIRVLELLDEGLTVRATAAAVGQYTREVSRVGKRYLAGGLPLALSDDPRPIPDRKLDSTQEAAIVAMVCGPPPAGRARWTVRLVTEHAQRRGIVDEIGRESIRVVLARHELKPWREKNVVRAGD
jgi:hypothetical protein